MATNTGLHFPRFSPKQADNDHPGFTVYCSSASIWYSIGILLNLCGSSIAVSGLFSSRWIVLSVPHGRMAEDIATDLNLHFGLWKACTENGKCAKPWKNVPGLDQNSLQMTQALVIVAISAYLGGISILVFKCLAHNLLRHNCYFLRFNQIPLSEIISVLASITTLVTILVVGQFKRAVILSHHQTITTGHGFLLTLLGLFINVASILFMALNRHGLNLSNTHNIKTSKHIVSHDPETKSNGNYAILCNENLSSNQRPIATVMGISMAMTNSDSNNLEETTYDPYFNLYSNTYTDLTEETQEKRESKTDTGENKDADEKVFPDDDFLLVDTTPESLEVNFKFQRVHKL